MTCRVQKYTVHRSVDVNRVIEADPGGARGQWPLPPGPVKISHKKDGH